MNKKLTLAVSIAAILGFSGSSIARMTCADGSYPPCETEGETATNSLSVPLWLVSDGSVVVSPGGAVCSPDATMTALVEPSGTPYTGYPIDPLAAYFVQGLNKWQAPCATWDNANGMIDATAAWGDNLSGDARLKAGSPIRVEIVLTQDTDATLQGYSVVKLEPSALDRESAYGILSANGIDAVPSDFSPMVFDGQAWITIVGPNGVVVNEKATAEVNATGKAIYGYNLRVNAAGAYTITYSMPNVNFTGWDVGNCVDGECSLAITVGSGGGGGGGKKGGR